MEMSVLRISDKKILFWFVGLGHNNVKITIKDRNKTKCVNPTV